MSIKENNEITVKIKCDLKEFYNIMEQKGFKIIDRFSLEDTYFIPNNLNTDKMSVRDILSRAVIIRNRMDSVSGSSKKEIVFKRKNFDNQGNILNQDAVKCEILNIKEAKNLVSAIGYSQIMHISEKDVVYGKNGFNVAVKDILGGDKLVEIETTESNEFNTIEKLIAKVKEYDIPVLTDDCFIKKAEIELKKVLINQNKK